MTGYVFDDGGRKEAGYIGSAGDCVTRAIAIATGQLYQDVYDALFDGIKSFAASSRSRAAKRAARGDGKDGTTPRNGVNRKVYEAYLLANGWQWTPTMAIGSGCKVHLDAKELPPGRLIVRVSKHLVAVIDGVIHDTHDPRRWTIIMENGVQRIAARCVYGYYRRATP